MELKLYKDPLYRVESNILSIAILSVTHPVSGRVSHKTHPHNQYPSPGVNIAFYKTEVAEERI